MKVGYSHLDGQFANPEGIFDSIRSLVKSGEFTLGRPVADLEEAFARIVSKTKYAIGVGTGTDAIRLSLVALGVGPGDEVITAANTFYATAGAIATTGAKPVFIDVRDDFCLDPLQLKKAITPRTKAIVPVHLMGSMCEMDSIMEMAKSKNIHVVEDACQGMGCERNGRRAGSIGITGCFSLHPLKNLNVWGDGGMISTDSKQMYEKLIKLRNHGLLDRDHCEFFGYNCRLDALHALVGLHIVNDFDWIIKERVAHADFYDKEFRKIRQLKVPERVSGVRWVHHNYVIYAERRNDLVKFLLGKEIDAKVHYPLPLYLQPAARHLGYKKGDFPVTDRHAETMISLPVHQHLSYEQLQYVVDQVGEFFRG